MYLVEDGNATTEILNSMEFVSDDWLPKIDAVDSQKRLLAE